MAVKIGEEIKFSNLEKEGIKPPQEEDVGFFESALAGVATGLWNIPKGFVSLGAEIYDLVNDTDTAKDVENGLMMSILGTMKQKREPLVK